MSKFNHPFSELLKNYLTFQYEYKLNGGPKDYNRASDIGKDFYSLYHKRIGTPYTNHPTPEGLGKMMAGDVFHLFIQDKFEQMGILKSKETVIEIPELNVKGHFDLHIGGVIDWDEEVKKTESMAIPSFMKNVRLSWIEAMRIEFGKVVPEFMADIKTISSFMFERMEIDGWKPMHHHALQQTNYWLGMGKPNIPQLIFYVCRDDFRMKVVEFDPKEYEQEVVNFWTKLNEMVDKKLEPPKPEPVEYDEQGFASINWKVLYSSYLTKITGFKTKEEFKEQYEPEVKEHNKNLTEKLEWEAIQKEFEKATKEDMEKLIEKNKVENPNFSRTKRGRLMKKLTEEK